MATLAPRRSLCTTLRLLALPGTPITRTISNERGAYRATLFAPARRVRVVRLGVRPRDLAIPSVTNGRRCST